MFINHDMKMLMEKMSESLEVGEKSFEKLSIIVIDMIEEEYQDPSQLINN